MELLIENLTEQLQKVIKEHNTEVESDTYWRGVKNGLETAIEVAKQCAIPNVVPIAISYEQFQDALKIVNEYKTQLEAYYKTTKREIESISKFAHVTKETKLYDTHISVRCFNILKANEDKLGININWRTNLSEFSKLSMSKFLQCRNAGKKTLQELKELCFYADVKLLP